jgi:hypothetical protein
LLTLGGNKCVFGGCVLDLGDALVQVDVVSGNIRRSRLLGSVVHLLLDNLVLNVMGEKGCCRRCGGGGLLCGVWKWRGVKVVLEREERKRRIDRKLNSKDNGRGIRRKLRQERWM